MNRQRWHRLMAHLKLAPADAAFEALLAAYSEPSRHYHNVTHIEAMLRHFDTIVALPQQELLQQPHEIELAIWFHDAVYDVHSATNERDSAEWAARFLSQAGYPEAGIARVESAVMATLHGHDVSSEDEALLVDIDLTILGTSESVYNEYEKNVRKEYAWVPWPIYSAKRTEILQGFLNQDVIYRTAYFQDKCETNARSNIKAAIVQLASQSKTPNQ